MEFINNTLVKREFKISNLSLHCWVFCYTDENDDDILWFKAHDIASFLGFIKPRNAVGTHVDIEDRKSWKELRTFLSGAVNSSIEIPSYWNPNTVFISEKGLWNLVMKSKLPEAKKFQDWLLGDLLPNFRRRKYVILKNTLSDKNNEISTLNQIVDKKDTEISLLSQKVVTYADNLVESNEALTKAMRDLIKSREDAIKSREDAIALSHRMADIAQDVVCRPTLQKLQHSLIVHEIDNNTHEIVFTRCQKRSLPNAVKRLVNKKPHAKEIYRNGYVPNGINILNVVKEILKQRKIKYLAKSNSISILDNLTNDDILSIINKSIYPNGMQLMIN